MHKFLAAMDIGTNSCRLIIVKRGAGGDSTCLRQVRVTRIGEGLGKGKLHLSRAAMDRTMAALRAYKAMIAEYPADAVRLLGTQALREADNSGEFAAAVKAETGFTLEIISGEREAYLSYIGAAAFFSPGNRSGAGIKPLVLDIGAGSTELFWEAALPEGKTQIQGASAPVGCLRLLESPLDERGILDALQKGWSRMVIPEPEAPWGEGAGDRGIGAEGALAGAAGAAGAGEAGGAGGAGAEGSLTGVDGSGRAERKNGKEKRPLTAVGGTATTLGAIHLNMEIYDPDRLSGLRMSRVQVEAAAALLDSLSPRERLTLPGMMPGREDLMPWGIRILLAAMKCCGRDSVVICDRDLLYGVLDE